MSEYFKQAKSSRGAFTVRCIYRLAHTEEWRGDTARVFHVVADSASRPFYVTCDEPQNGLESATKEEWDAMHAIAEEHQLALDKAAKERADAEAFGIRVKRKMINYYSSDSDAPDDFIIRATKTQWIGLHGRYHRTGNEFKVGRQTQKAYLGSSEVKIRAGSIVELERLAAGRERVDFVKERKAKESK